MLAAAAMLSGCATLPSNGPTARQVQALSQDPNTPPGLHIVEIAPIAASGQPPAPAVASPPTPTLDALASSGRVGVIGPGDVLEFQIYETGASLFSGGQTSLSGSQGASSSSGGELFDSSAHHSGVPGISVDEDGRVALPYIGQTKVAGLTPFEIGQLIEHKLVGKSQNPQVVVNVLENVANTVYVSGAVHHPGRLPLSGARERLLDAIATAGGSEPAPEDTLVRFTRRGQAIEQSLTSIVTESPADLVLLPGDRIELIKQQRSYTVFGATGHVSQQPFAAAKLSLAEAIARVGGPSDQQADPAGIYIFRYESDQGPESGALPTVYHLDLLKPSSYLLAQRFAMRDKDVIYFANSAANQPTKVVSIINQLFSPIFLARQAGL